MAHGTMKFLPPRFWQYYMEVYSHFTVICSKMKFFSLLKKSLMFLNVQHFKRKAIFREIRCLKFFFCNKRNYWNRKQKYLITQCGDSRIFLSLRFYVKSKLLILKVKKLPFLTHLEALNLAFYNFLHFSEAGIFQINKIENP